MLPMLLVPVINSAMVNQYKWQIYEMPLSKLMIFCSTIIKVNKSDAKFKKLVVQVQSTIVNIMYTNPMNDSRIIHYNMIKIIDGHHKIEIILCLHLFKSKKHILFVLKKIVFLMMFFTRAQKINTYFQC